MKKILTIISAFALVTGMAQAAPFTDYSTDFNSADGFIDATSIDEIDGWNGRAIQVTANTAVDGYTALGNGPAFTQKGSGGSWAVGETITITGGLFYNNTTGRSRIRLGLIDSDNDTSSQPDAGFEWDVRSGGHIYALGGGINEDTGLDISTGQGNGELFTVSLTKSATLNEIDVVVSVRTWSDSFTATAAALYGAANVYGHVQHNGAATNGTFDSYSQTIIPEPATFGLVAAFGGAIMFIRRRFMI